MIDYQTIENAARQIMSNAAIDIPPDYRQGIEDMAKWEQGELSCFVLQTMMDNWKAASEDRRPMCADTGLPRYYVKLGNNARLADGFTGLERALRSATAKATHDIPLRPNRVHPLWRTDHNNNVVNGRSGSGSPCSSLHAASQLLQPMHRVMSNKTPLLPL